MTVKQLIKKLLKLPQDAEVIIPNTADYIDGYYAATEVDDYTTSPEDIEEELDEFTFLPEKAVLIDTDYERRVAE